jgi:hypothetical protein
VPTMGEVIAARGGDGLYSADAIDEGLERSAYRNLY